MALGWITVMHAYPPEGEQSGELNSVGVYVEAPLGQPATGIEIVGRPTFEIEAALLTVLSDPQFDGTEWWTYSANTWALILQEMPHLAIRMGSCLSSEGLVSVVDPEYVHDDVREAERPLDLTLTDYEMFCAIRGAIGLVGSDLVSKVERYLDGL